MEWGGSYFSRSVQLFCGRPARMKIWGNIWLLGDSITYGAAVPSYVPGGYRTSLYTNLTARGYSFQFVGTRTENSSTTLTSAGQQWHDGWSGFTIADCTIAIGRNYSGLYDEVSAWHATLVGKSQKPDIILLMIGINDLNQKYEVEAAPDRLDLLLTRLYNLNPQARVVISSLLDADSENAYRHVPPNTDISAPIENYNAAVASIVATRRAAGQSIEFVDIHVGLTLDDLSDGLHPSEAGYIKMADIWADAIEAVPPHFKACTQGTSSNEVGLEAQGALGTSYSVWSATNLASSAEWNAVTNGNVPSTSFTVTLPVTNSQCFFRFSAP